MTDEREIILEAIKNGATSVPAIRKSTGLSYQVLYPMLERLTPWEISRQETPDGWDRFYLLGAAPDDEEAREPFCVQCHRKCRLDVRSNPHWHCSHCDIGFMTSRSLSKSKPKPKKQVKPMAHIDSEQVEAERVLADMRERGTHPPVQLGEDEEKALESMRAEDEDESIETELCDYDKPTSNGDSVIHETVKSGYEVIPNGEHRGRKSPELDYERIETLRAQGMSVRALSLEMALGRNYLSNRRTWDKRLNDVLNSGHAQYANREQKPPQESKIIITKPITKDPPPLAKEEVKELAPASIAIAPMQVIEIPQRKESPKEITFAWSKDFEDDNSPDGMVGLTYLYLISMLHDGMEEYEKQAVWTLVLYLKRMQAATEQR